MPLAIIGRSSRSTTTGIATVFWGASFIVHVFVEAVGPLQQGLRPHLNLLFHISKILVEAVGPLQQGLRRGGGAVSSSFPLLVSKQ